MSGYTSPVGYNNCRLRDGIFLDGTVIQYLYRISQLRALCASWYAQLICKMNIHRTNREPTSTGTLYFNALPDTVIFHPQPLRTSLLCTVYWRGAVGISFESQGASLVTIPKRTFHSYTYWLETPTSVWILIFDVVVYRWIWSEEREWWMLWGLVTL